MKKILTLITSILAVSFLAGCAGSNNGIDNGQILTSQNGNISGTYTITGTGRLYGKGVQYIEMGIEGDYQNQFQFNKEQKVEYYSLSSALAGKKITMVEYTSEYTVILTVDGNITNEIESTDNLEKAVSIDSDAFNQDISANASIRYSVGSPKVAYKLGMTMGLAEDEKSFLMYVMYIDLPYGTFNQDYCTSDHIKMEKGNINSINVIDSGRSLKIIATDIDGVPTITLDKETNFFKKELKKELNFDASTYPNVPGLSEDIY